MKAAKNNPDGKRHTFYHGTRNLNTVVHENNPNNMSQSFRARTVQEHAQSRTQNTQMIDVRDFRTHTNYQTPNSRHPAQPTRSTLDIPHSQVNIDATFGSWNNFETKNIYGYLPQNDTGCDLYQAGKTKASTSPLEDQPINKNQRENNSEQLENSYMKLTPSPTVI